MKDFFISYNKADRDWAEWIAWTLEEAGYTTILQAWDFAAGSNFVLEMDEAAKQATRTIAVLSPDYLSARYTQPEWAAAFAKDPTGKQHKLILVCVRDCDVEGLLGQIVYIDLCGLDEAAARDCLLAGISGERAKPTTKPTFPGGVRSVPERPTFPGALPPVWNIPHPRNRNFTGRKRLLADLHSALQSGKLAALTQALTGLGGVGKTQLALEYAYRHAEEYQVVSWVQAEEPVRLASDFAGLAQPLDLSEKDEQDQSLAVAAVRRWLERNGRWLLIFDNVPGPVGVHDYLPRGGSGHIIITSRDPNWGAVAAPLDVPVWPRKESLAFLRKRTGQGEGGHDLAEELGDLPLALEQAAAYIETCGPGLTLRGYLDLFLNRRKDLWNQETAPGDYRKTVATTWSLAMERVREESPAAADLLNLCAFLAPEDIPLSLVRAGAANLPEPLAAAARDELALNEAVVALRRYSLIERSGDSISVHRLLQAVTRDRLSNDAAKKGWTAVAVRLVQAAFAFDQNDLATWALCGVVLPHALAAVGHGEDLDETAQTSHLLNEVGVYLWRRAQYGQAKSVLERALRIDEAAYGPDHPKVAIRVNNLGSVLRALGDLEGARAHFERALRIDEAAYGPDHPNVAIRVNNLGNVLRDLGDLEGARAHYDRALGIMEKAYGPQHPNVATAANNLGKVLRDLGDLEGARAHFERALRIDEAAYGPDHPDVAIRVNNLGNVLQDLGDLKGARAHYERALRIDEAAYGPDHPDVARDVNNLGSLLRDLGDPEGARAHFERALHIMHKTYGDDHPRTKLVRRNLESLDR